MRKHRARRRRCAAGTLVSGGLGTVAGGGRWRFCGSFSFSLISVISGSANAPSASESQMETSTVGGGVLCTQRFKHRHGPTR